MFPSTLTLLEGGRTRAGSFCALKEEEEKKPKCVGVQKSFSVNVLESYNKIELLYFISEFL